MTESRPNLTYTDGPETLTVIDAGNVLPTLVRIHERAAEGVVFMSKDLARAVATLPPESRELTAARSNYLLMSAVYACTVALLDATERTFIAHDGDESGCMKAHTVSEARRTLEEHLQMASVDNGWSWKF